MTRNELYELIIKTANEDERIRAVTMEGSSVTDGAVKDAYSDFDLTFFVSDIREFLKNKQYMQIFGDILICQAPEDWYMQPYDYEGTEKFVYLCQYKDGNRIDMTIIDVSRMSEQKSYKEPRKVLINKDNFEELKDITSIEAFIINKPSAFEYFNTCNEFRWLSVYVSKGICRREFYYAKKVLDQYMMDMFVKMLNIKVALDNDFKISLGANSKYLKNYLSTGEMNRFQNIFSDGSFAGMQEKLFVMYDYFDELAAYVGAKLGYEYDKEEVKNVRAFIADRLSKMNVPVCKKALIKTERLSLKPYSDNDADSLVELLTNPEITKTFMVPEFETKEQAESLAKKLIGFSRLEDTKHLEYGIYLDNKLIGFLNDCGFEGGEIEIGYVIHPDYQGHGYATEVVSKVIDELKDMGFRKIVAGYFAENVASFRVMQKCGMIPNGLSDEEEYRGVKHVCKYCEICF